MHPILRYSYKVVDRVSVLKTLSEKLQEAAHHQQKKMQTSSASSLPPPPPLNVACDIEALVNPLQANQPKALGEISLIQLCCPEVDDSNVNIVDVLTLGKDVVKESLGPVIESKEVRKIMFDCRRDVEALSSQLKLRPHRVLDLQLVHVANQWKMKASDRRSGLQYVLKQELGIDRAAGDAAVSKAMMHGNRPVWDIRPLPDHFLEYAADDVRHLYALHDTMRVRYDKYIDQAERISEEYTNFYAQMKPVEEEADVKSQTVRTDWLERYFGPAGVCGFCGARGHHEDQCFKKREAIIAAEKEGSSVASSNNNNATTSTSSSSSSSNNNGNTHQPTETQTKTILKCGYCGALGHLSTNCFKKHPHLLKCSHCGQMGHNESHCFVKNPCEFCGGKHKTENCLKKKMADREKQ